MTGEAQFRQWLVGKLKVSRWIRLRDEPVDELAARLGVQVDVLQQAQRELDEERQRAGLCAVEVGSDVRRAPRVYCEVAAPERVHADWAAVCHIRQLTSAILLRSLIWTLLAAPSQPQWLGRGWIYHGERLPLTGFVAGKRWPFVLKTEISQGASRALTLRARATHTTPTALVRGQVLELLEGRLKRVHVVTSVAAMWDDETRYWTNLQDRRKA